MLIGFVSLNSMLESNKEEEIKKGSGIKHVAARPVVAIKIEGYGLRVAG